MTMGELFTEAARAQGTIAKINTTLAFLKDTAQRRKPERALAKHERALANIAAEMATRYVSSDDDRRAVLFKMMGGLALTARAYFEALGSEKDNYYDLEFLRNEAEEIILELDRLR
jgi:hypothetical protein